MKKRLKILLPLLALAAIAALALRAWRRSQFLYAGTVEATDVDLSSRVASVIERYHVDEGQPVKAGQTLVTLTCEEQRLAADLAQKDFERAERLRRSGSMPQEAYDRARFQRDNTALQAGWCVISSPIDGVVLDKYGEDAERVVPGTRLLTVADLAEVWAYIYVPQPEVARLRLDMPVRAYLPEADRWFDGRISHIRSEAEFTPKNVQTREERTRLVYGVKVTLPNPDGILKPGMAIEVRLP